MSAYRLFIRSHSLPRSHRIWLTWVLCLCAWRGPMPIVHCHSLESQVLASNLNLAAHAVHHHGHDIGHGDSGWHVHFVWPAGGGGDLPADEDHPTAPGLAWPCLVEDSARSSLANELMVTQSPLGDVVFAEPLPLESIGLSVKPLPRAEIISKRISPQAALCVARC